MRNGAFLIGILVAGGPCLCVFGDTLTLNSGEILTGSLVNLNRGTLAFRSKIAGKAFYPADEVKALSTTKAVAVELNDEVLLVGRLRPRKGGTVVVTQEGRVERPIDISNLRRIDALPASSDASAGTRSTSDRSTKGLNVTLESGYRWRTGTRDYGGPFTRVSIEKSTQRTEISAEIDAEYVGDDARIDRFFSAETRVKIGPDDSWRPEVAIEVERDADKAIDVRGDVTARVMHQFSTKESGSLEAGVGLGFSSTRADGDLIRSQTHGFLFGNDRRDRTEEIFADLTFRYSRRLFKDVLLSENFILRPSLTDPGALRGELESALTVPVTPRLSLRMDLTVDYENDLILKDLDEWRTSVGASLRLRF